MDKWILTTLNRKRGSVSAIFTEEPETAAWRTKRPTRPDSTGRLKERPWLSAEGFSSVLHRTPREWGETIPALESKSFPMSCRRGSRKEKNTPGSPFTFIFVGSLGYYPNADGILFFADRVLPLLRAKSPLPFVVRVVGKGLSAKQSARLAAIPEVEIAGWVEDVSSCYKGSDAAIIPIRAGGGTRIKALEAFAHGVPVVSTSLGLEGLPVEDETHVLVGDSEDSVGATVLPNHDRPWIATSAHRARFLPGAVRLPSRSGSGRPLWKIDFKLLTLFRRLSVIAMRRRAHFCIQSRPAR